MKNYDEERKSIGKEAAIKLAESEWWKDKSYREITLFQLFTDELSMPFNVFHEALEKSLGRGVYTHEIGMNYNGIVAEFLGEQPVPTLTEIIELIPEEKRIIVELPTKE